MLAVCFKPLLQEGGSFYAEAARGGDVPKECLICGEPQYARVRFCYHHKLQYDAMYYQVMKKNWPDILNAGKPLC